MGSFKKIFTPVLVVLVFALFPLLPLFKSSPVLGAACGDWNLGKPAISGNTATFSISPPAGGGPGNLSILAIRGMTNSRDIDIPVGATSIKAESLQDGFYRAVMVFTTCEISNTRDFAIPDAGTGIIGSAECTNFRDCVFRIDTPTKNAPRQFGANTLVADFFSQILPIIIGLGAFLSVIMILISAAQFVLSNGDPESAAKARGRLIFALIGFALLVLAFAITKVIDAYFLKSGVV